MKQLFTLHRGFTLIELAMVIFIIGLLLGGLLVPYATSVEQKNREETKKRLQEVQEALYGFAVVNGYLPCPDCEASSASCTGGSARDDGKEDRNGNVCSVAVGNLPWATLNVPQFDAWGYAYTYKVTAAFANLPGAPTTFNLTTAGDMHIFKSLPVGATGDVAQYIPAIVISHGKDHYVSAQSAEEVENYERNPTIFGTTTSILSSYSGFTANKFIYKDYTRTSTGDISFDDMMIWISPFLLKNKLVSAGKLP